MVESRNTKGEALPSQAGGLLCLSALQWRGGHVVRGADRVTLPPAPSDPHHHHHTDSAMCIILTTKMRDKNNRCIFVSAILFMI